MSEQRLLDERNMGPSAFQKCYGSAYISQMFQPRAGGVEPGWTVQLNPKKIHLKPGEAMTGQVTIMPPEEGENCTSHWITVTSWTPPR
jgi:hypothetical protein